MAISFNDTLSRYHKMGTVVVYDRSQERIVISEDGKRTKREVFRLMSLASVKNWKVAGYSYFEGMPIPFYEAS